MTANDLKRCLFTAILVLLYLTPASALADVEGIVRFGVTQQSLQDDFVDGYGREGYLPMRLTGYQETNGETRYFTRWVPNKHNLGWRVRSYRTLAEFNSYNTIYRNEGFYLVDVSGYETGCHSSPPPNGADRGDNPTSGDGGNHGCGVRYAGIWHKNTESVFWTTYVDVTKDFMQILHDTIGQEGWRPHRIEGYENGGQSRFISVWYHLPHIGSYWHSKLTRMEYDQKFDDYREKGFAPFHVDSHTQGGVVYFTSIWRRPKASPSIRTDRDFRAFQRYYNNNWVSGYNIDNFYAALTPNGVRFGGIWSFNGVPDDSTFFNRLRKAVDGAPAYSGAAVLNLTTGEEFSFRGNNSFAIASTSKIGILYPLLREIDLGNVDWTDSVDSDTISGTTTNSITCGIVANTNYTVSALAWKMIACSDNWATNLLINLIGVNTINSHLADPAKTDLQVTRINRYMLGGPSLYGNGSASGDRAAGIENLSTPLEMVKLLRKVLQDNVLSASSADLFWDTLQADSNGLPNTKGFIGGQVASMFNPPIVVYNKPGSNGLPREMRADAARLTFPDGQEVLVAFFMDFISDSPDDTSTVSNSSMSAAVQAILDAAKEVANRYY